MSLEETSSPPGLEPGGRESLVVLMGVSPDDARALAAFAGEVERVAGVRFWEAGSMDGGLARVGLLRDRGASWVALIGTAAGEREVLRAVRAVAGGSSPGPAILLAGRGEEELVERGLAGRACDFLLRHEIDADRLLRSIRLGLEISRRERGAAEARSEREIAEARFASLWELVPDGLLLVDPERCIRRFNRAALDLLGLSDQELSGAAFGALRWRELDDGSRLDETFGSSEATLAYERRDGTRLRIGLRVRSLPRGASGERWRIVLLRDRSQRAMGQLLLSEARHFAGLGRLLAGAAHDCNNLLTPLLGYCELLLGNLEDPPRARGYAREIERSARLLAELVRRLLDESRSRPEAQRVLAPDRSVSELAGLLRSLVGQAIDLSVDFAAPEARVQLRQGQLEQVVLNLAANARDAMPLGGKLTIRTRDQRDRRWVLEMSDTGAGIPPENLGRVFDPAFTTKAMGKGTGLGLWIVRAIAEEAGGRVEVRSEVGKGTVVRVELPILGPGDRPSGEITLR